MENNNFKIVNGDSLILLDTLPDNSIDSIITDPPYEIGFMNKSWDSTGIAYNVELWKKCLRVLKPGGYLLAFGSTRTFHRIACAIEDSGFEIRDTIMYLYGSGFPKSHNVGLAVDKYNGCPDRGHRIAVANRNHPDGTLEPNGENLPEYEPRTEAGKLWKGYGSALKPAYEPVIMARKPLIGSIAENVLKYGTGAINIDECRIGNETINTHNAPKGTFAGGEPDRGSDTKSYTDHIGRFPANIITDGDPEIEKQFPDTKSTGGSGEASTTKCFSNVNCGSMKNTGANLGGLGDSGSACRFFYTAKASKKDRDEGLDALPLKQFGSLTGGQVNGTDPVSQRFISIKRNTHTTVKPTDLMQYLIRLVTPKNGTILDIFNGSGSTGKAAAFENRERGSNYKYIGFELSEEYCEISKLRIDYAINKYEYDEKQEREKTGQLSLFDI